MSSGPQILAPTRPYTTVRRIFQSQTELGDIGISRFRSAIPKCKPMIGRAFCAASAQIFDLPVKLPKGDLRQKIPLIFNAIKIESPPYAVADSNGSIVKQGSRLFDGSRQETFEAQVGYARPSLETGSATGTCPSPPPEDRSARCGAAFDHERATRRNWREPLPLITHHCHDTRPCRRA